MILPPSVNSENVEESKTHLLFSWSGLNAKVTQPASKEAMQFGISLHSLLDWIVEANPQIWPTFLSKVDLAYAYMRILGRLNDTPFVLFLIPKGKKKEE